jgi:RNA polymerase sigma factor (sigma-70 family)
MQPRPSSHAPAKHTPSTPPPQPPAPGGGCLCDCLGELRPWVHRRVSVSPIGQGEEDVIQECCVRFLSRYGDVDDPRQVRAHLFAIAFHVLQEAGRRPSAKWNDLEAEVLPGDSADDDPLELMLDRERNRELRQSLIRLDRKSLRLLVEHHLGRRSVQHMAERRGKTEDSVKSSLWRSRQRARSIFDRV